MEANGLRPQPPKWKPWGITKPDKAGRYAADLLKGDFSSPAPNRVWATDISWVFTGEGVMYLAIVLDLFSRYIVGWALECLFSSVRQVIIAAFGLSHCDKATLI
jgi:transposase InsO family protein